LIGGVDIAVQPDMAQDLDFMGHMVEDQQRIAEHKDRLGHFQGIMGRCRQLFKTGSGFVTQITHRPAVKPGQAFHRNYLVLG